MNSSIGTSTTHWWLRGFFVGILLIASLNALSYFFRSERGGNLLGIRPRHHEALGFPCELWESGNAYGGYFVDLRALLIDGLCAVAFGVVCGQLTLRHRARLNRLVETLEQAARPPQRTRVQFSLRGLLLGTGLAALTAAGARLALAGQAEVLGLIYLLGPWFLVVIAFLPLGLSWQQRVVVLIPTAGLLIVAAVAVGVSLKPGLEFDKVLLAIFICWTPQSALAALGLTAMLLVRTIRSER
jgi:hypothetical protein